MGTGVNVWDEQTQIGYWNATTGVYAYSPNQLCSKDYISVKPNTTYRNFKGSTTNQGELLFFDAGKNFISSKLPGSWVNKEFTTPENCYFLQFNLGSSYGAIYNYDISINYPETDTEYHAYTGDSISVNWQDSAGTVYGGNLAIAEDGGCALIKYPISEITLTGAESIITSGKSGNFFSAHIKADAFPVSANTEYGWCISNELKTANAQTNNQGTLSNVAINTSGRLIVNVYGATTLQEWRDFFANAITPIKIYYRTNATPITYTLPDVTMLETVVGTNNIWADTGDISVTYYANYSTRMGSFRPLQYNPTSLKQFNEAFIIPKYPN